MRNYPAFPAHSYPLDCATQFSPTPRADILPSEGAARTLFARGLAADAAIYGMPAVLQYREMYRQAVDQTHPRHVGFHRFLHDRDLAGPGYQAFKTPNSDTLYSNAWLNLSQGPVLIEIPDVPLTYYTLQFLDMHANASNIGTRTFGNKAGKYLVAHARWQGEVPQGVVLFRVATPYAWILMRVFAQREDEVIRAGEIQDRVTITPMAPPSELADFPPLDELHAVDFFRALDHVVRTNGVPHQEDALVYRFRAIGIAGKEPFNHSDLDPATQAGMEAGYADAMQIIAASRAQLGLPTGTGWTKVDKARYGFNYLSRAVTNYVGLGANVEEENYSFNTFVDAEGVALDGSGANYSLDIAPPPVDAFWSLTLYDANNFELFPNALQRYLISERQLPPLAPGQDTWTIAISHAEPKPAAHWLPAPNGPFYLVFRAYLPRPEMIASGWRPQPVTRHPKQS